MTIHIAGEEDEPPALAREIVAAIDRLTEAVERLTFITAVAHDIKYTAKTDIGVDRSVG